MPAVTVENTLLLPRVPPPGLGDVERPVLCTPAPAPARSTTSPCRTSAPPTPPTTLAMGSYDNVGYALAMDAFKHADPARAARISGSVCTSPLQPGVNPVTFPLDYAGYGQQVGTTLLTAPRVTAEPPLPAYARG